MRIRQFRSVVNVLLVLALVMQGVLVAAPPAGAQQPGFGQPMMPGMGMPYGIPGYGMPGPGWGSDLGGVQVYPTPAPPQQQAPSTSSSQSQTAGSDIRRVGPSAPGLCTSQTYQSVTVTRPTDIRTVGTASGGERSEEKKDGGRGDHIEVLSPIEAGFQLRATGSDTFAGLVFEMAPPSAPAAPTPYAPAFSSAAASTEKAAEKTSDAGLEDRVRMLETTAVANRGQGSEAPKSPVYSAGATRFLGPYGAPLRQYGYAVFSSYVSTFAPVDDVPVGPDYVIGPGDTLSVSMWGPLENTIVRTVDRSGQILLPKVGDVRVWGLTFSQADRLIREHLARYFRGFQTSVTMGRLRTVRVQVIGEVCQPGSYTLTSLATLSQGLYAAGGPTKLGSLRHVRLLRNSHVVGEIDLYDFLLRGDRSRDYRLEAGDTIFVPTIGDVAAIAGEVKRPAIYEVKRDVRLADLIESAGGAAPTSYLKRVQIVRAQPNAERVTIDVDLSAFYLKGDQQSNPPVHGGDLVLIHRNDGRIYNTVKVHGSVKYPGVYELKPMMRLTHLLPADRLLPESYTERIEITRRRPDYSVEVVAANLKRAWEGDVEQDLLLKGDDEVTVRTAVRATRTVSLTGQVMRPGTYVIGDGERLSSVLERAGGFTERANLKGAVFTRASLRKVEQDQLNAFVRVQEQRILAEGSTTVAGADKDSAAIDASLIQARRDFLRAIASRVAVGRMVIKVAAPDRLKSTADDLLLADGDNLEVPEPVDSVLVIGSVRSATSVFHATGQGVDYYVGRVGGYAKEADKKEIHIVKADGSAVAGFANIRTVEPGDTIIVPRSEDSKIRWVPAIRDGFSILGSTLTTVLSLTALAVLF